MTVVLGLLAAASVGTSDFLGGLGSRRAESILVTAASNLVGFVLVFGVAAAIESERTARDLGWGALGGAAVAVGLVCLYAGYARARVSIAAPVAGVGAAALPVLTETVIGDDDLSARGFIGVVLGLIAVGLVSISRSDQVGAVGPSILYGLGGAAGVGTMLICLSRTSEDSGLWPIVSARGAGFAVLGLIIVATRRPAMVPRAVVPYVLGIAILITLGNTLFLVATRVGSTAVAAVLTSLFPAATVFWAWVVFRERLRPVQVIGLALALVAVSLIVAG